MTQSPCTLCQSPKSGFRCGVCQKEVCKKCVEFQEADAFSFMKTVPAELKHLHYCPHCFDEKVLPARRKYDEVMERAKGVLIFDQPGKRLPPLKSRANELLSAGPSTDRPEAYLRLAFLAAEKGFDALIQVNGVGEKVRNVHGYQTTMWKVTGYGANLDAERFKKYDTE